MPTVEDYFDDDTDLPLPSSSSRHLPNTGIQGALLEEISTDDPDVPELDYDKIAEQGRGIYGEGNKAPISTSSNKGKSVVKDNSGIVRPSGGGGNVANNNTPMNGFMGDMMRLQQAEEERMEKMRKQFGDATLTKDMEAYKGWNSVYPIYFDAKVSIKDGRRVQRKDAMWWPQARQIAEGCRSLGLPSVLEPDKTHPADWENPGRVKVQFEKDGRYVNPIIKNRTQLYRQLAQMMTNSNPSLKYKSIPKNERKSVVSGNSASASATATKNTGSTKQTTTTSSKSNNKSKSNSKSNSKSKSQTNSSDKTNTNTNTNTKQSHRRHPYGNSRPPRPTIVPSLDDRLPLHTPLAQTGVAVASVKRELETEKENKKKGIGMGSGGGGGGGGDEKEGGKEKVPKIKRMVVRGKR